MVYTFGYLVGLTKQTELLVMTFVTLWANIFDMALFEFSGNIEQVWNLQLDETKFNGATEQLMKMLLSGIVIVRTFSLHLYIAFLIVMFWPATFSTRPTLMLPWLIVSAVKNIATGFVTLGTGLYICAMYGPFRPACLRFFCSQILDLSPSLYMWIVGVSFYRDLSKPKPIDRNIIKLSEEEEFNIILRRRKVRSMIDEEILRKQFESRRKFMGTSAVEVNEICTPEFFNETNRKISRSLGSLLDSLTTEAEIYECEELEPIEEGLNLPERTAKLLGISMSEISRIKQTNASLPLYPVRAQKKLFNISNKTISKQESLAKLLTATSLYNPNIKPVRPTKSELKFPKNVLNVKSPYDLSALVLHSSSVNPEKEKYSCLTETIFKANQIPQNTSDQDLNKIFADKCDLKKKRNNSLVSLLPCSEEHDNISLGVSENKCQEIQETYSVGSSNSHNVQQNITEEHKTPDYVLTNFSSLELLRQKLENLSLNLTKLKSATENETLAYETITSTESSLEFLKKDLDKICNVSNLKLSDKNLTTSEFSSGCTFSKEIHETLTIDNKPSTVKSNVSSFEFITKESLESNSFISQSEDCFTMDTLSENKSKKSSLESHSQKSTEKTFEQKEDSCDKTPSSVNVFHFKCHSLDLIKKCLEKSIDVISINSVDSKISHESEEDQTATGLEKYLKTSSIELFKNKSSNSNNSEPLQICGNITFKPLSEKSKKELNSSEECCLKVDSCSKYQVLGLLLKAKPQSIEDISKKPIATTSKDPSQNCDLKSINIGSSKESANKSETTKELKKHNRQDPVDNIAGTSESSKLKSKQSRCSNKYKSQENSRIPSCYNTALGRRSTSFKKFHMTKKYEKSKNFLRSPSRESNKTSDKTNLEKSEVATTSHDSNQIGLKISEKSNNSIIIQSPNSSKRSMSKNQSEINNSKISERSENSTTRKSHDSNKNNLKMSEKLNNSITLQSPNSSKRSLPKNQSETNNNSNKSEISESTINSQLHDCNQIDVKISEKLNNSIILHSRNSSKRPMSQNHPDINNNSKKSESLENSAKSQICDSIKSKVNTSGSRKSGKPPNLSSPILHRSRQNSPKSKQRRFTSPKPFESERCSTFKIFDESYLKHKLNKFRKSNNSSKSQTREKCNLTPNKSNKLDTNTSITKTIDHTSSETNVNKSPNPDNSIENSLQSMNPTCNSSSDCCSVQTCAKNEYQQTLISFPSERNRSRRKSIDLIRDSNEKYADQMEQNVLRPFTVATSEINKENKQFNLENYSIDNNLQTSGKPKTTPLKDSVQENVSTASNSNRISTPTPEEIAVFTKRKNSNEIGCQVSTLSTKILQARLSKMSNRSRFLSDIVSTKYSNHNLTNRHPLFCQISSGVQSPRSYLGIHQHKLDLTQTFKFTINKFGVMSGKSKIENSKIDMAYYEYGTEECDHN